MNLENIGIQGNLDAYHLLYQMLQDDGEHWSVVYQTMWPEQRRYAVMALCRMAMEQAITDSGGHDEARDAVFAQLRDFVQAKENLSRTQHIHELRHVHQVPARPGIMPTDQLLDALTADEEPVVQAPVPPVVE